MNKIFFPNLSQHKKWFLGLMVAIPIIVFAYYIPFSGFGENSNKLTRIERDKDGNITSAEYIQSYKTLWDWLILAGAVAIPIVIFHFQQSDKKNSDKLLQNNKDNAEKLIYERDKLENYRLHEEALQLYINDISRILLDDKLNIVEKKGSLQKIAIKVARARTLSILRRLDKDGIRKGSVIMFLIDVELISSNNQLNLETADLRHANLPGAELGYIKLNNADLSNANLEGANLEGAILYRATLIGAKLQSARLQKAKLSRAKLGGAEFNEYTDLSGAYLHDTDFTDIKLPPGINLSDAKLNWADLRNANLSFVNLENANLAGTLLQGANLQDANLTRINLTGAKLDKDTNFSGATFFDVNLKGMQFPEGINFSYAKLNGANLSNTILKKVDFGSTVLSGANLSNADLSGAKFANTDLSGVNLDGADLTDATDLTLSQIESAKNWHNAILPPNLK